MWVTQACWTTITSSHCYESSVKENLGIFIDLNVWKLSMPYCFTYMIELTRQVIIIELLIIQYLCFDIWIQISKLLIASFFLFFQSLHTFKVISEVPRRSRKKGKAVVRLWSGKIFTWPGVQEPSCSVCFKGDNFREYCPCGWIKS